MALVNYVIFLNTLSYAYMHAHMPRMAFQNTEYLKRRL